MPYPNAYTLQVYSLTFSSQIWFQNRRQNTRRKARPLLPHEIAAFGLGGMAALSSEPGTPVSANTSFNSSSISSQGDSAPSSSQPESIAIPKVDPVAQVEEPVAPAPPPASSSPKFKEPTTISLQTPAPERTINIGHMGMEAPLPTITPLKPSFHEPPSFSNSVLIHDTSRSQPTPGYLANRWNMSSICGTPNTQKQAAKFMTPSTNKAPAFMTPSQFEPELPSSCPLPLDFNQTGPKATPKSSSNVRLSLSLDGHATLVSADQSSSPPHQPPQRPSSALSTRRPLGLQRSYSAAAAVPFSLSRQPSLTSVSGNNTSRIPRLPTGRSRDSKTWELCADTTATDDLTAQAENESSGSAVAAISLIRSTSVKSVKGTPNALKQNNNKRNTPSGAEKTRERPGSGKRAMLRKGGSALGRMEGVDVGHRDNIPPRRIEREEGAKKGSLTMEIWDGDDDKENWMPGEGIGSARRPLPSYNPRSTIPRSPLRSNTNGRPKNTGSTPLGRRGRGKKTETKIFEDTDADDENRQEPSEEVAEFMRGAAVSPSKKGDLDCIQGLLSLSQGNWR